MYYIYIYTSIYTSIYSGCAALRNRQKTHTHTHTHTHTQVHGSKNAHNMVAAFWKALLSVRKPELHRRRLQ